MEPAAFFMPACLLLARGCKRVETPHEKAALAAFYRDKRVLSDLKGIDLFKSVEVISTCDTLSLSPLFIAGYRQATEVALEILKYPTPLIDDSGLHFVHLALDPVLFEEVLKKDRASVKTIDPVTSKTLLHKAVESRDLERVCRLLELEVDLHAKDFEGKTALARACYSLAGLYPLEESCIQVRRAIAQLLIEKGADPKSVSYEDLLKFFEGRFHRVDLPFLEELGSLGVDFKITGPELETTLDGKLYEPSLLDKVLDSLSYTDSTEQAEDGSIDFVDFDIEAVVFLAKCGVPPNRVQHWAQSLFAKFRSPVENPEFDSAAAESINKIFQKIEEVFCPKKI